MLRAGPHELFCPGEIVNGRRKLHLSMAKAGAILVALVFSPTDKVQAASFDCTKATTKVEKMICVDPELSNLDDELAKAYRNALKDESQAEAAKSAQKLWLKERNRCEDAACAKKAYATRLQNLGGLIAGNSSHVEAATVSPQAPLPVKKPLYGHCVDVQDPGNCGRFQSGKGYTVCEKYLEHLNSLAKMPKCEVPVPPSFQRPDWEEVDVMQHLEWAYQAETIRFSKYSWYTYPDFSTWQKEFLEEKDADRIVPAMRKVRVKPLGEGKEIAILAYTRNREGCRESARKLSDKATYWSGFGYVHFLIHEAPGTSLVERLERNGPATDLTEMLLYAGKPYFVEELSPAIYDTPGIMIYAIAHWHMPVANEPEYLFKDFCNFEPLQLKYHPISLIK